MTVIILILSILTIFVGLEADVKSLCKKPTECQQLFMEYYDADKLQWNLDNERNVTEICFMNLAQIRPNDYQTRDCIYEDYPFVRPNLEIKVHSWFCNKWRNNVKTKLLFCDCTSDDTKRRTKFYLAKVKEEEKYFYLENVSNNPKMNVTQVNIQKLFEFSSSDILMYARVPLV